MAGIVQGVRGNSWPIHRHLSLAALAAFGIYLCPILALAGGDLGANEQKVFQTAVERVLPSVVRIETVGGLERVGRALASTAPCTGLIVRSDGYIIASAFSFAQKPSSIVVTLAGGTKQPARLLATDHNRMLVLLKLETKRPLPVPEAAAEDQMRVGQWAIAVGRSYDPQQPNLSVGIISGLKRVWGKAIQTDAKISPANYGGPLVDLDGRVLGLLVALSPDSTNEIAGAEWYDSGIGFAIPLGEINQLLDRLQQGDLWPGMLGISLTAGSMFGQPAQIAAIRPNSPAAKAGLKAGDKVVRANGKTIERQVQLRSELNRLYAGDKIDLVAIRDGKQIEFSPELVKELAPYQHPFLGILPKRGTKDDGIEIRFVYPDSPAAKAGMVAGDAVLALDGELITNLNSAWQKLNALTAGDKLNVRFRNGGDQVDREVQLAALPDAVPAELPPANADVEPGERPQAVVPEHGVIEVKVAEFANQCFAYVPEKYDPNVSAGVVLWLHGAGGYKKEELLARWRGACDAFGLVFVAPLAADVAAWKPTELDFIQKSLREVMNRYAVDPARVVAAGEDTGAALAYLLAFRNRELFHGIISMNGAPVGRVPENDPAYRLAIMVAASPGSRFARQSATGVEQLRSLKYPVTTKDVSGNAQAPAPGDMLEFGRWIDTLDRL